jgi:ankyrin repeat protein
MKKGVNINAVNANGETPLFKAIENKDTRGLLLQELFSRGADPNIANSRGDYILHYVSRLADRYVYCIGYINILYHLLRKN